LGEISENIVLLVNDKPHYLIGQCIAVDGVDAAR
jgi:hypothetical protein